MFKCEKCGQEFSEPVLEFHKERCNIGKENKEKSLSKMNKEELLAKAVELEIEVQDKEAIDKKAIIALIEEKLRETK